MTIEPAYSLELLERNGSTGKFRIKGVLNFDSVSTLNQHARELFRDFSEISIDLSSVSYVNSAALVLLLEWKRQALLEGKTLQLLNVPQKLQNIARISEIEKILSI